MGAYIQDTGSEVLPLKGRSPEDKTMKFEVGKTYATSSICDHECIYSFVILARTAKTVTVQVHGKTVRRGLSLWEGNEQFKPFGSYSMCAIIGADDLVKEG